MLQPDVFQIVVCPKNMNAPSSSQAKGAKMLLQQNIFFCTSLISNATPFVLVRLVLLLGFLEPQMVKTFSFIKCISRGRLTGRSPPFFFFLPFLLGKLSAWQSQPAVLCRFFRHVSLCLHGLYRETKPEKNFCILPRRWLHDTSV